MQCSQVDSVLIAHQYLLHLSIWVSPAGRCATPSGCQNFSHILRCKIKIGSKLNRGNPRAVEPFHIRAASTKVGCMSYLYLQMSPKPSCWKMVSLCTMSDPSLVGWCGRTKDSKTRTDNLWSRAGGQGAGERKETLVTKGFQPSWQKGGKNASCKVF